LFFAFIDYGPIKLKFGMENVKLISYLVSFFFFGLVCSSLACFLVWLACLFVGVRRLSCLFVCIGCLVFNNILTDSKKKKKVIAIFNNLFQRSLHLGCLYCLWGFDSG
jgi:hypothetical protein